MENKFKQNDIKFGFINSDDQKKRGYVIMFLRIYILSLKKKIVVKINYKYKIFLKHKEN